MSPLLFNIVTIDVQAIMTENVKVLAYAVNMVQLSTSPEQLQPACSRLEPWASENDLPINKNKTVSMVFRKRKDDNNKKLQQVNHFNYLQVTFQTCGTVFSRHTEKTTTAILAMNDINLIHKTFPRYSTSSTESKDHANRHLWTK